MKRFILSLIALSALAVSCTKETTVTTTTTTTHISNTEWYMFYKGGPEVDYAPLMFISGGKAMFPASLPHSGYWFSGFMLPVPPELNLNIDTDSLKLVANARNVAGDGTANEISLSLENDSSVIGTWQGGSSAAFCQIRVGSQTTSNITEQLTDPSTYAQYSLAVQDHQVTTAKNGTTAKTVSYTGSAGKMRNVKVYFRGFGELDWVKLYKGSKLIMTEDFSTNGKTTAVWTAP